jgi:hypothetical protein
MKILILTAIYLLYPFSSFKFDRMQLPPISKKNIISRASIYTPKQLLADPDPLTKSEGPPDSNYFSVNPTEETIHLKKVKLPGFILNFKKNF